MRYVYLLICLAFSLMAKAQFTSIYQIDTLPVAHLNPAHQAIHPDGSKLLLTAAVDSQLYYYDFNSAVIKRITNETEAVGSACWSPNEQKVVFVSHPEGVLKQQFLSKVSSLLIPEREIKASNPQFNHEGNLLLFIGQRQSQQQSHIFTYDFKYDNLNQLTRNTAVENPRWSPSDELISYNTTESALSKIVLLNWYGVVYDEIISDTLNLTEANWADSDYKMIYVGHNAKRNYLISSRLSDDDFSVLLESEFPLSNPIWIPNSEKVLVTCTNYAGERIILRLNLDEQTTYEDVLLKILKE